MCKASSATWGGSPEGLGVQQLSIGCQIRRGPHFSKPRRPLPPCLHKFAGQHLCAALDTWVHCVRAQPSTCLETILLHCLNS